MRVYRDHSTEKTLMAKDATAKNQRLILANQRKILTNQKRIEANQKKLDRVIANQKAILKKLARR